MTEAHTGASPLADLVRQRRLSPEPSLPEPAERRRIREVAGVSLEQVADELGVSHAAVSYWERGVWNPSTENAAKYRALLSQLAEAAGTEIAQAS